MNTPFSDFMISIDTKQPDQINKLIEQYQGEQLHPWRSKNLPIQQGQDLYYYIGYFIYRICYDLKDAYINQEFVQQFKQRIFQYNNNNSNKQEFYDQLISMVLNLFDVQTCSLPSRSQYNTMAQKTHLNFTLLDYAFIQDGNPPRICKFKNGYSQIILKSDKQDKSEFCLIFFTLNEIPNLVITSIFKERVSKIQLIKPIQQFQVQKQGIQIQQQQQTINPITQAQTLYVNSIITKSQNSVMDTICTIQNTKPCSQINYKKTTNVLSECQLCCCNFSRSQQGFLLNCKCVIHKECLTEHCKAKAEVLKSFDQLLCPQCSSKIEIEDIKQILDFDLIQKIIFTQVDRIVDIQCYNCQTPIIISEKGKLSQIEVECSKCQAKICSQCKCKYHGKNQDVYSIYLFRVMFVHHKELKQLNHQRKVNCLQLFVLFVIQFNLCAINHNISTKDDKCDHVKCQKCQTELCAACSCIRSPSIAHGNQYHRKGCVHFREWIDERTKKIHPDSYQDKCSECHRNKKLCSKPIPLDEYKKLKQF